MNQTFADVLKVVNRYKNERVSSRLRSADFSVIKRELEMTFILYGFSAAMRQAKTIAAAFRNLRVVRTETRTQELRRQADRMGIRYV